MRHLTRDAFFINVGDSKRVELNFFVMGYRLNMKRKDHEPQCKLVYCALRESS